MESTMHQKRERAQAVLSTLYNTHLEQPYLLECLAFAFTFERVWAKIMDYGA
jgi:hypothetical protein